MDKNSPLKAEKPWFMKGGSRWPTPAEVDQSGKRKTKLWPHEDPDSDRMLNQYMFVPPISPKPRPTQKILMWSTIAVWEEPKGSTGMIPFASCPVSNCELTTNEEEAAKVDAIMFLHHYIDHQVHFRQQRTKHQVWIYYSMESPIWSEIPKGLDVFNWTATYMQRSDIPRPYGKWIFYNESRTEWDGPPRNFASGKTKKVAWFVSNCKASNNRWLFATELSQYIQVDIYGRCGKLKCDSEDKKCDEYLDKDYKFYLAFENCNCREYITEKFFEKGLGHKVIPIVLGAPREDYERVAPKDSFIHVEDFATPKDLAAYLHEVDHDDNLFNSYFKWKDMGEVLYSYFYCRLCAMLHDDHIPRKYHPDFHDFWKPPNSCIGKRYWRDLKREIGGELPSVSWNGNDEKSVTID
ncbi:glycoprotein 3-alpha-L-fucosyltransferase A-like [Nilaparvata lugens]|uniref:glycoprotein 3-alpha-L-fucosyltransferase A-like n=1 Tax=Nilaparvata lugens TaxID=108931 RepID=UPI00193DBCF1|nr:glycoprotein 3-alpha-L-fucosyltransferase A-like [Nilaparvata lugens]